MKKMIFALCVALMTANMAWGQLNPIQKGEKWGFCTEKGKMVTKAIYDKAFKTDPKVGLAAAQLNGKWGFLDADGDLAIPHQYEKIFFTDSYNGFFFSYGGIAEVQLGKTKICINQEGEQVPGYTGKFYNNNYAPCYSIAGVMEGKAGLVNKSKEIIIPMEYEAIGFTDEEHPIMAQKDGKYGFINLDNEVVIDFQYEGASSGFYKPDESFEYKVARVKIDGAWHYIDKEGNDLGEVSEETIAELKRKHAELLADLEEQIKADQESARADNVKEVKTATSVSIDNGYGKFTFADGSWRKTSSDKITFASLHSSGKEALFTYEDGKVEIIDTNGKHISTPKAPSMTVTSSNNPVIQASWSGDNVKLVYQDGRVEVNDRWAY